MPWPRLCWVYDVAPVGGCIGLKVALFFAPKHGVPRVTPDQFRRFSAAMPFWASLGFVPLIAVAAMQGGWWLLLMPIYGWGVFTAMDFLTGLNLDNPDTETPLKDLFLVSRDHACLVPGAIRGHFRNALVGCRDRPSALVRRIVADVRRGCHVGGYRDRLQP